MPNAYTIKDRILKRIEIDSASGCWLWTREKDKKGYARLHIWYPDRGIYVPKLAHRLSIKEFKNIDIENKVVCHSCDTPSCVNPDHLFIGSTVDNLNDMRIKGRERGVGFINRNKTHCNKGHSLSGDNLRIEGKKKARRCRECERKRKAKR